ncbi:EamA family transporter [Glaesserella parasuis]|uniref:EamA family transporter n=1 Tax=Glaesserella parasuis TaxID=738 RepID=UPI00311CC704
MITYQVLELLMPISTAFIAYLLLGETISPMQLVFAGIVIVGASMALGLYTLKENRE